MSEYYDENELDDSSKPSKGIMLRLLKILKPYWGLSLIAIVGILLVSSLDAFFTLLQKDIIDQGILTGNKETVLHLFLIYLIISLVQLVGGFSFIYFTQLQGYKLRFSLRKNLFEHIQKLSLSYFSKTPLGWIMSRVNSDTEKMGNLLTWGLIDSLWAIANIITASVCMFTINWKLALIVIGVLPVMIFIAFKFRVKIYHHYRLSRKANSRMTASLNENITGVNVVKALRREEKNLDDFKVLSTNMYRSSFKAAFLSAVFLPTIQTISAVSLVLVMWRGGLMIPGELTPGGLQAFISYIMMMLWPIQDLARVYADMQNALASSERVFSLLDTQAEVANRAITLPEQSLLGKIDFDKVCFHYEDGQPIIQELSFSVPQGQTVALVGPTGGGKTTIVNLLCRFYEPASGTISIAGHDYLDYDLQNIQSRIGVVLQTPHLFSGSIMENLRYGRLDASEEEIIEAAQLAGADHFIRSFEHGYEQNVGEGGNLLSVGQKQLISIARALLAKPDIFVMDEATSSVDTLTESLIQDGMLKLMQGRTSFIIAHRLSTIKHADQILHIANGQITEQGNHESLMRLKGQYYHLYTRQFRQDLETRYDPFLEVAQGKKGDA